MIIPTLDLLRSPRRLRRKVDDLIFSKFEEEIEYISEKNT